MNAAQHYRGTGKRELRTVGNSRDFDPNLLFNRAVKAAKDAVMRLQHVPDLPVCCDI